MSMKVWTKPNAKIVLFGDRKKSKNFKKKALFYVNYLMEQMGGSNIFKTGIWNSSDGSTIKVSIWRNPQGAKALVRIWSPETGTIVTPITFVLRSGLSCIEDYAIGGPWQFVPEEQNRKIFHFNLLEYNKETSSYEHTGWEGSDQWKYAFEMEDMFNAWTPFPKSFVARKSSCYSGEMRKVVQVLAGYGIEIPYDYKWPKTHGIFVNSSTKQRWVIEISSDGVYAWPLPVVDVELKQKLTFFGKQLAQDLPIPYIPAPAKEGHGVNTRLLANSGVLTNAYLGAPWSSEIGWAFSYTGHEAQQVVVQGGYGAGGFYSKAARFKVSIQTDNKGDPIGATLTEMEREWAWYNDNGKNIRVQAMTECAPAQKRITLATYDTPTCPTTGEYEFPVHVYYEGDTEKVIKYHYGNPVLTNPADVPYPSTGLNGVGIYARKSANKLYWTSRTVTTRSIWMVGAGSELDQASWQATFSQLIEQKEGADFPYTVGTTGHDPAHLMCDCFFLEKTVYNSGSHGENYMFSFVIPWGEREAYLLFEELNTSIQADEKRFTYFVAGRKRHTPGLSSYWGTPMSSLCQPGGNGYNTLCKRVFLDTCDLILSDPSPPTDVGDSYIQPSYVGQSVSWASKDPTYCQKCSPYLGKYLLDLYCYYPGTAPQALPYVHNQITTDFEEAEQEQSAKVFWPSGEEDGTELEDPPPWQVFHGVYDEDNTSCVLETPWWMLQATDAFSSRALLKATASPYNPKEPSDLLLLSNEDPYNIRLDGLPTIGIWETAWFGVPHADVDMSN